MIIHVIFMYELLRDLQRFHSVAINIFFCHVCVRVIVIREFEANGTIMGFVL